MKKKANRTIGVRRRAASSTRKVRVNFGTVQHDYDRIRAVANRERMTVTDLISEALHIHLHKLETNGDPHLRRKSVCWSCGTMMDAATAARDGTARAGIGSRRTKKP